MSFYIALPSDSSAQYFPENKISGFTTKLPREIVLDGTWECGVTEVRYPLTFFNVLDDMAVIKARNTDRLHTVSATSFNAIGSVTDHLHISPGFYTKSEVIDKINGFISDDGGEIKIDKHTGKVNVTTGEQPLFMTPALYDFLGHYFEPENTSRVFERLLTYKGQRVVNTHRSFDTLFIYCDMLAPRIVGDTNTSLLVTLPNESKHSSFGDTVTTRFTKIRYYPVAKRRFHTIRIDVLTDVGVPAKFEGGKVFVEIHFRKVINA
jgi:hypothetical protein